MNDLSIGFVCPSTAWGGLEMNVFRLAVWLKRRGWNIILYGNPNSRLYDDSRKNSIAVRALVSRSKMGDVFLARKLARQIREDNVRILLLHMNKNLLLTVLAKILSLSFFKLIYVQHMHVGGAKKDFFHTREYRYVDRWIAPLPMFKRILMEKTDIDPGKIEIIPHGIELERFTADKPDKQTSRKRLGLPCDVFIAGVVGRLDPKKCQHILIEACAKVHQAGYRIHLLIVGDESLHEETHYADHLRKLTERLNLESFVHFRPYQPAVEYVYAALDLFVLTSSSETYGMVTIEAMASGLPVIGTSEGGTADIITDRANGLLVKPLDADDLAGLAIELVSDKERSEELAEQARRDAIKKYSHTRQCDLLESLFNGLSTS